jgi:hypothetical protein
MVIIRRLSYYYFYKPDERGIEMGYKVLSSNQVEQFMELGWVKLEEGFARKDALAGQDYLWGKLAERGVHRDDSSSWTQPMVRINEVYESPEFQRCNTLRMAEAIEDLIGEGRWATRSVYGETESLSGFGWWPVNFAFEAEKPWDVPAYGWHWDGSHFRHFVDSPDQGLLCLCLFSEIGPKGGGTLIAEGSHKLVAKFLAQHPEGLEPGEAIGKANRSHPWLAELTGSVPGDDSAPADIYAEEIKPADTVGQNRVGTFMENWTVDAEGVKLRVLETLGSPGDAILCHPFLYHASSQNHIGVPRFMCNRTTPLKERLQLRRENSSEYSPLELSIRNALAIHA